MRCNEYVTLVPSQSRADGTTELAPAEHPVWMWLRFKTDLQLTMRYSRIYSAQDDVKVAVRCEATPANAPLSSPQLAIALGLISLAIIVRVWLG